MSYKGQNQLIQPTYYDVLGVSEKASDTDIKLAYRRLVLYWHPDKQIHDPYLAEQNLKIINEAYSGLKTRPLRDHYNQILYLQTKAAKFSAKNKHKKMWDKFWNWLSMLESNKK